MHAPGPGPSLSLAPCQAGMLSAPGALETWPRPPYRCLALLFCACLWHGAAGSCLCILGSQQCSEERPNVPGDRSGAAAPETPPVPPWPWGASPLALAWPGGTRERARSLATAGSIEGVFRGK